MYGSKAESKVEAIRKTEPHEQCMVDDHVTDNTCLECDPLDYSRYNKVVVFYLGCHHEHFKSHRKGEFEKALLKCL